MVLLPAPAGPSMATTTTIFWLPLAKSVEYQAARVKRAGKCTGEQDRRRYSQRRATMGSITVARRAGM